MDDANETDIGLHALILMLLRISPRPISKVCRILGVLFITTKVIGKATDATVYEPYLVLAHGTSFLSAGRWAFQFQIIKTAWKRGFNLLVATLLCCQDLEAP